MIKGNAKLPPEGVIEEVACVMRQTVAMLDGSADMLERMADMASTDVACDLHGHAEAIRAIRHQMAGPPRHRRFPKRSSDLECQIEAGTAD